MTPFTVVWDSDLEAHFVDAWVGADSQTRALLREIANWVDENLSVDPDIKGKEGPDSIRILALPIGSARVSVAYQVLAPDRQVRVIRLVFKR